MELQPLFAPDRARELGFGFERESDEERERLVEGQLRDSLAVHQPLIAFKGVFARNDTFKNRVERVREDGDVEAAARPYAWNGGRPLKVMREIVLRVAASESTNLTLTILNFPPVPGAGLGVPGTAARWKKGGNYWSAARMLARLGAGECLVEGCSTIINHRDINKAKPRYCHVHSHLFSNFAKQQSFKRADREAILALLHGIGDVLGVGR
jgi:hypothetical protein